MRSAQLVSKLMFHPSTARHRTSDSRLHIYFHNQLRQPCLSMKATTCGRLPVVQERPAPPPLTMYSYFQNKFAMFYLFTLFSDVLIHISHTPYSMGHNMKQTDPSYSIHSRNGLLSLDVHICICLNCKVISITTTIIHLCFGLSD